MLFALMVCLGVIEGGPYSTVSTDKITKGVNEIVSTEAINQEKCVSFDSGRRKGGGIEAG